MKPLGRRAYGSIGHLPNSRLGPSDSSVEEGQYRICCEKARDKHDVVFVQEKLDGSNVAIARVDGTIYPLTRAGYVADTSPYEQHHMFHRWAMKREGWWRKLLTDGERISGEWLAQAHGTMYNLDGKEPFFAFDIFTPDNKRLPYAEFIDRIDDRHIQVPWLLHAGTPIAVEEVMERHKHLHSGVINNEVEGVVYRVERHGKVDFLAKWVRPDKEDGKYLESVTGNPPVWNWREA